MQNGGNVLRSVVAGVALAGATSGVQAQVEKTTHDLVPYGTTSYASTPESGRDTRCAPSHTEKEYAQKLRYVESVYRECELAKGLIPANLWNALADTNQDGRVNAQDTGRIVGGQLAKSLTDIESQMLAAGKGEQFYQNITSIIRRSGVDIPVLSTKEALVEAIQSNPELIRAFSIGWNTALLEGIPFQFLLQYGEKADEEWQKNLQKIESHPEIGNLLAEVARAEADLPRAIDALLAQGKITDQVHKQALVDLQKNIDSGEVKSQLLAQALSAAPTLLTSYSSSHTQVSLQNTGSEQMDVGQYKIKFGINAGVQDTSEGTAVVLMTSVGVRYQLDESSRITANIGVNSGQTGVFPVAGFFYAKTLDQEVYAAVPLSDTNTTKTTVSGGVGYGLMGAHVAVGYQEDRGVTFIEKMKLANELIETAFSCEASDTIDVCMGRIQDFVVSETGKQLDILDIGAIRGRLLGSQFDTAPHTRKLQLLTREKKLVKNMYLEYLAAGKLGETKIALTGALFGIFGIMPNVNISWLNTENASDPVAQAQAHLLSQGYNTQAPELMKPEEVVALLDQVFRPYAKVSYMNDSVVLTARNAYLPFGDDSGSPKNLTDELRRSGIQIVSDAKGTKISQNQIILPLKNSMNIQLNSYYQTEGWTLGVELQAGATSNPEKISVQKNNIVVAKKPTTATPRNIGLGAR